MRKVGDRGRVSLEGPLAPCRMAILTREGGRAGSPPSARWSSTALNAEMEHMSLFMLSAEWKVTVMRGVLRKEGGCWGALTLE